MERDFIRLDELYNSGFVQEDEYARRLKDLFTETLNLENDLRQEILGSMLYKRIEAENPGQGGKITGMLLDARSAEELVARLMNSDLLRTEVADALRLLAGPRSPSPKNTREELTALLKLSPEDKRVEFGTRLYYLVAKQDQQRAGKITGMFLEGRDDQELIEMILDRSILQRDIDYAISLLNGH